MSTSGFGQIPSSGNVSPKKASRSNNAEIVKIIRLPDALQNNARALRVEGTVTQSNNNGSVRIQTERGAIDVQFPNNNAPEKGQQLEVNIPAGRPPRQANVERAQPQAPAQNTGQPTSSDIQRQNTRPLPQTGQNAQTSQRIPIAPVPPQNIPQAEQTSAPQQQAAPPSFPPAPLLQGANVRLVPLPPNQAIQIAQQSLVALPVQNTIVTQTTFTANLIAQNALSQISQSALSIRTLPPTTNALQQQNIGLNLLQPTISNIIQPTQNSALFQSIALQAPAQPNGASPLQSVNLNAVIAAPTLSTPNAQNFITTFQPNATLTPANNLNGNALGQNIGKIDVQVLNITQNTVSLTSPNAQNGIPALTQITPPLTSNNNATTLTGQITGLTQQGQPLITLQLPGSALPQSFILQYTPNNITIGSQVQLAVQNVGLIPTSSATNAQSPALTSLLQGFQWTAFDDAIQTIIQSSPQAANSIIRSLPNAGNPAQLGAVGAAVMAAVRSGDLAAWLGDKKIETLQRLGKSASLSRLTQDTAAPRLEAASNTDWRAVPLPMFWEGEIHKITLFMRQESQNQNKENNGDGSTRFIFDLNLSRMGEVQLDGLLKDDRLDLVVRTQSGFSAPMQQMMRGAYSNAIKQAGMNGEVLFQGHTKNWVHVIKDEEKLGVNV